MKIEFKLKSCPFCGGEAEIIATATERVYYGVHCKGCNILVGKVEGGATEFLRTPLAAADLWNRRANDKKIRA